jgi:hypothetical protein
MLTLPPLRVKLDDLVHERDVRISSTLALAHEVWIATLVSTEERDVQHDFSSLFST